MRRHGTDADRGGERRHRSTGVSRLARGSGADSSALNHGVALSFFFADPERHLLKVYWPLGDPCLTRKGDSIDLTPSEEVLWREVAELAAGSSLTPAADGAEPGR
jgi:hypothetical protein